MMKLYGMLSVFNGVNWETFGSEDNVDGIDIELPDNWQQLKGHSKGFKIEFDSQLVLTDMGSRTKVKPKVPEPFWAKSWRKK
jgi:hypothetical protein